MQKHTLCVHSGTCRDNYTRGVNTPIYTSSSFEYMHVADCPYPRHFNTPNQQVVERKVASLEKAENAVLFSSGMAAISTTILAFAGAGDHVVLLDALYGGTHSLVTETFTRLGIDYTFVASDPEAIAEAVTPKTAVIVIETPSNPLMKIIDIRKVAEFAGSRGITTIIDSTFASPINQTPIALGIDIVVHSGTKFLGGHSDLCCGIAAGSDRHIKKIRSLATHLGGSLNAFSCYLLERSLKTLALRVERQTDNAARIAEFLNLHQSVNKVYYPGLPDFPGHDIARAQMHGFGAMLSFELSSGHAPEAFLKRLKLITPAVSLGGVESIICSPARTSHVEMNKEERERIGVTDTLLRFSTGIEDVEDLLGDLAQALS